MESYIEKRLQSQNTKSQSETNKFISEMQAKIALYEKNIYDKGDLDSETLKKIKKWRAKLLEIARAAKEQPADETLEEAEGYETLKLLHRQLEHADINQQILDRSTLKLASLDLSTDELDKAIVETREKFETSLKREQIEYRRLIIAFVMFLLVCAGILIDKLRSKFF